jgi:hypothetical protein
MEKRVIKYRNKFYEVDEALHKGYEASVRAFIRSNNRFHSHEAASEKIIPNEPDTSFEDRVADKLLYAQILDIAKTHLCANDYVIFKGIFLDCLTERELAAR